MNSLKERRLLYGTGPRHDESFAGHDGVDLAWVADVAHTGSGKPTLRYLARYVSRSALRPKRILGYDRDGRIRLQCYKSGTNRPFVIALAVIEFLCRWLTHVLPKVFVRVRHHG